VRISNIVNKKTVLIVFISSILALFCVAGIILSIQSQESVYYEIKPTGEKNQNSKAYEVRIAEVSIDGQEVNLGDVDISDGAILDKGNIVAMSGDKPSTIKIKTEATSQISITFVEHEWSGIVEISNGFNSLKQDLYSNTVGESYVYRNKISNIDLVLDYLNTYSHISRLISMFILAIIINYICVNCCYNVYIKMKNKEFKLIDVIKLSTSIFIIYFSSIFVLLSVHKFIPCIIVLVMLAINIYRLKNIIREKFEYSFVIISVLVGTLMIFIIPPFNVPDENTHFINSYQKSFFGFESNTVEYNTKEAYIELPEALDNYIEKYMNNIHSQDYMLTSESYFSDFQKVLDIRNISDSEYNFANTKHLNVIPYIPTIITIAMVRNISLPIPIIFYLCRFVDLSIWVICGYLALNIMPGFKKAFILAMLLPISVQQAIGINQDYLTNALFFLLTALLIKEIFDKDKSRKIDNKAIIKILIISILLSFCKIVYSSVVILALLIPSERFKNRKSESIIKLLIISIPMILTGGQLLKAAPGRNSHSSAVDQYNIMYVVNYPIDSIKVYINTAVNRICLDLLNGLLSGFGWCTKWANSSGLSGYIPMIIYSTFIISSDEDDCKLNKKQRIYLLGIAMLIIGLLYTAMFYLTNVGESSILGLQSRYFIPVVILLYMMCSNEKIKLNFKNNNLAVSYAIISVMGFALYIILSGYYI
jgi:Predicted membrane protein